MHLHTYTYICISFPFPPLSNYHPASRLPDSHEQTRRTSQEGKVPLNREGNPIPRRLGNNLDPIPKSCGKLLNPLLRGALVELQPNDLSPRPYLTSYDENAQSEHKVQDLIDNKQLTSKKGVPLLNSHPLSL